MARQGWHAGGFRPNVKYDDFGDVAYVQLRDLPFDHGRELDTSRALDFAASGQLIGAAFIGVREGINLADVPEAGRIADLLRRHGFDVSSAHGYSQHA